MRAKFELHTNKWIYVINLCAIGLATGIQWLSISKVFSVGTQPQPHYYLNLCNEGSYLTPEQKQICRLYYPMMNSVADGAKIAVEECQNQFVNEQWNCSTQSPIRTYQNRRRRRSVFGNGLISGTREAAFVYAISSAAVAYSVTRDCSKGLIEGCGCDKTWPRNAHISFVFQWGGCSDNIAWGREMSRKFIDVQEDLKLIYKKRDSRKKLRKRWKNEITVNLNNNRIGRETVAALMRKECKCHGVSNSCEQITCWRVLPSFYDVGRKLKQNYNKALQVHVSRKHDRPVLKPKFKQGKKQGKLGLVYLRKSPVSCATAGRVCDSESKAHNSCKKLCCGRGYLNVTKHVTTKCQCKFQWCCDVYCKTCNSTVVEYICR